MAITKNPKIPAHSRLVAGHKSNTKHYRVQREHGCNDYLMIYTCSGEGFFANANDQSDLSTGKLLIIPPNTPQDYGTLTTASHWEIVWIHCHPWNHLEELLKRPTETHGAIVIDINDSQEFKTIDSDFKQVYQETLSSHHRRILWAMNTLERALLLCDKATPLAINNMLDKRIQIAIEYINKDLKQTINIKSMAKAANLSVSRFSHLFTQEMHMSPLRYIETKRLNRARDLLAYTELSITDIATDLGFIDPFYFTRRFSKKNGLSPREFRKRAFK